MRWGRRGVGLACVLVLVKVASAQVPRGPDIYFAATRQPVVDQMLMLAEVKPGEVVVDLGSGDGRILILAAQKYGARGMGVEINAELVERSRLIAREAEVGDRVSFVHGDLFDADVTGADVVTLYLSPSINSELEPKLRRQLKPGARVVSHQFPIGQWAPDRTTPGVDGTDLHLWIIK
ncbi:MAG: methyltransferase domain-containing protein [Vicinamibacterales bacterium]